MGLIVCIVIIFILVIISVLYTSIKIYFNNIDKLTSQYLTRPKKENIIISLTTIQRNIKFIQPTIKSLLNQSIRPRIIYLNVSFDIDEDYLLKLDKLGIIKINRLKTDYGPATKLFPCLINNEINPETIIIYLDDDMIYNNRLIEHLYKYHNKFPDKALCISGINIDHKNRKLIFNLLDQDVKPIDIMEGYNGCLIKRSFFPLSVDDILNFKNVPKEAFYVDDVYISGLLSKFNIKKIKIPYIINLPIFSNLLEFIPLSLTKKKSLSNNTNKHKKNDWIVIDHFSNLG